jgi:FKBP-type peptidyl-prolyl cis-trans isomerase FkpA
MKKFFAALIIISSAIIAGCVKSDTKCGYNDSNVIAPPKEIDSLARMLQDSGIVANQATEGYFYQINNPGSGIGISNLCSNLAVTYKGTFFNGHVFDSTATGSVAYFQLGQVIVGWQKGVPLISKGGDITLYIPPTLGYGINPVKDRDGNVVIPGNSYLIFNVHIADIQQ